MPQTFRQPQLRQAPFMGPTFAGRTWSITAVVPPPAPPLELPEWLVIARYQAEAILDIPCEIITFAEVSGPFNIKTRGAETIAASFNGRIQRPSASSNAHYATIQGGARRLEGWWCRAPVGTPVPVGAILRVTTDDGPMDYEITGHDPIRTEEVLLTIWIIRLEK